MIRPLATFALGLLAGIALALLLTQPTQSRQASAPRPAAVTPLAPVGTSTADRGADSTRVWALGRTQPSATIGKQPASTEAPATAQPSPGKTPRPAVRPAHGLRGLATWYRYIGGQAAAGPRLRAALGAGWRGSTVTVNGVRVRLTDFMGTHDRAKVIDLDAGLFRRICGPLSIGVCEVTVRW